MGRYDHDMPVFTSDGRGGAKKRPASTTGTTPKRRWEPRTAGAETEAWINADIPGGEKVQEQLAATKRWQEMERHHVDGIMTSGMTAPTFIQTDTNVRAMQGALGVKEDGVWGPGDGRGVQRAARAGGGCGGSRIAEAVPGSGRDAAAGTVLQAEPD